MFLTVTDDHSGEVLYQRKLTDDAPLDVAHYARQFAAIWYGAEIEHGERPTHAPLGQGAEFEHGGGAIPLGCADFTVELSERPGGAVCWSAQSFFVGPEGGAVERLERVAR